MDEQQNITLPALQGTEKQVAWAEQLRAQMMAALETYIAQARARVAKGRTIHPDIADELDQIVARARRRIAASWWIDRRSDDPLMLASAVAALIRKEQQAKETK